MQLINYETIKIIPIAFMRGTTFGPNSFIIADEAQNMSVNQMKCLLTRIGKDSKMVITGDLEQYDKSIINESGLVNLVNKINNYKNELEYIEHFEFDEDDIVRHNAIKEILKIYK